MIKIYEAEIKKRHFNKPFVGSVSKLTLGEHSEAVRVAEISKFQ